MADFFPICFLQKLQRVLEAGKDALVEKQNKSSTDDTNVSLSPPIDAATTVAKRLSELRLEEEEKNAKKIGMLIQNAIKLSLTDNTIVF